MHNNNLDKLEDVTGTFTGLLVSASIYASEIANHSINTVFVLLNTGLAVLLSHKFKKWLERNDKDQ